MDNVEQISRPVGAGKTVADEPGRSLAPRTGWIRLMDQRRINGVHGRPITLNCNGHVYNFKPNTKGHYTVEVPFAADFAAILSIGAGYAPYGKQTQLDAADVEEVVAASRLPSTREAPYLDAPNGANPPRAPRTAKKTTPRPGKPAVDPAAG